MALNECLKASAKPQPRMSLASFARTTQAGSWTSTPVRRRVGPVCRRVEADRGEGWWKHFDVRDTQIAAIAREYGLTIATRNVRHFPFCQTENPFEFKSPTTEPAS